MTAPKPDTPTKQEHDAWVEANGRPYTQRPRGRRRPKEITDMTATTMRTATDTWKEKGNERDDR